MRVPAIVVDAIRSEAGAQPGAIEYRFIGKEMCGIAFRCPCGCGGESWMHVRTSEYNDGWAWNGNLSAPTLTPSILQSGMPCKWHGYLTAGVFIPC